MAGGNSQGFHRHGSGRIRCERILPFDPWATRSGSVSAREVRSQPL